MTKGKIAGKIIHKMDICKFPYKTTPLQMQRSSAFGGIMPPKTNFNSYKQQIINPKKTLSSFFLKSQSRNLQQRSVSIADLRNDSCGIHRWLIHLRRCLVLSVLMYLRRRCLRIVRRRSCSPSCVPTFSSRPRRYLRVELHLRHLRRHRQ